MPSTNLIIALVFAALFGIALIWLLFYYTHRYIHLRYLELDHWFHLLTRSACPRCSGTGVDVKMREKSPRRSGSRSRRREGCARALRMVETDTEWNAIPPGQAERVQRPRRTLPATPSVQGHDAFNLWQGWQGQSAAQQMYAQPMAYQQEVPQYPQYPQVFPQTANPRPYAQGARLTSPFPMPAARRAGSSVRSAPVRSKPPRRTQTERSEPQPQPGRRREPRVQRDDIIHIADGPPYLIREAIKKRRQRPASSSESSGSGESAEAEIPRTSIPVGSQRHANPVYQQQQYPQAANQAPASYQQQQYPQPVNQAQAAYQQQWNDRADQFRYASPYARPPGRTSRGVNAGRRYSPSNAPSSHACVGWMWEDSMLTSAGNSFETSRWRADQRREYVTRTLRRRDAWGGAGDKRKATGDGSLKHTEPPRGSQPSGGGPGAKAQPKPAPCQPPADDDDPRLSPMPQPVVEEPSSDCGAAKGNKPIILGMSSRATGNARWTVPSAPSPLLNVWSLSSSPVSALSSPA
jgi:hypothetical protein